MDLICRDLIECKIMNILSLLFSTRTGVAFTHSLNADVTIPYGFDAGSACSDSHSWNWGIILAIGMKRFMLS